MSSEPLVAYGLPVVKPVHFVPSNVLYNYWTLTKPEINFLIGLATAAAFVVGNGEPLARFPWVLLVHTLLGTVMVASGAGTLNQVIEREFDAQMRRTSRRPIATGRIELIHALVFGILLSLVGCTYLALAVRPAASLLAVLTLVWYLFLYTPLKRRTPMCTLVGAFPGAMPVLIGYVAVAGKLDSPAWLLYAISFPLAIPAFHGDCLDVPRGLRTGRIRSPSTRKRKSLVHGMAKRAANPGVTVSHSCASRLAARQSGGHGWNAVAQSEFPLFRRQTHRCPIERGRPPAAFGIYHLSSLSVRAPSARQGLR